uniref:Uncharacterized protein n=1 Tax=Pseudictyota dubia TaxID=2749911 RepID=A0A6U2EDD6_9STRA
MPDFGQPCFRTPKEFASPALPLNVQRKPLPLPLSIAEWGERVRNPLRDTVGLGGKARVESVSSSHAVVGWPFPNPSLVSRPRPAFLSERAAAKVEGSDKAKERQRTGAGRGNKNPSLSNDQGGER